MGNLRTPQPKLARRRTIAVSLYRLKLTGQQLAASTSLEGMAQLLVDQSPGRYTIEEVISQGSFRDPKIRVWGWAVKQDNGRVELVAGESAA